MATEEVMRLVKYEIPEKWIAPLKRAIETLDYKDKDIFYQWTDNEIEAFFSYMLSEPTFVKDVTIEDYIAECHRLSS